MDIIKTKIDLSFQAMVANKLVSKEAKKKMAVVISMADFSIRNIAKSENFPPEVLLTVLGNELINKAAAEYLANAEKCENSEERRNE